MTCSRRHRLAAENAEPLDAARCRRLGPAAASHDILGRAASWSFDPRTSTALIRMLLLAMVRNETARGPQVGPLAGERADMASRSTGGQQQPLMQREREQVSDAAAVKLRSLPSVNQGGHALSRHGALGSRIGARISPCPQAELMHGRGGGGGFPNSVFSGKGQTDTWHATENSTHGPRVGARFPCLEKHAARLRRAVRIGSETGRRCCLEGAPPASRTRCLSMAGRR